MSTEPVVVGRRITDAERFSGRHVALRLVTLEDCTPRYLAWLTDVGVTQYLETRWDEQTLESIRRFVSDVRSSAHSYLFAIIERTAEEHIGNIKIGPINWHHRTADVSYFIGEKQYWGRGYATDAIRIATRLGFERLDLERVEAGVYADNAGSARALERAGFSLEGRLRGKFRSGDGRDDHLLFGCLRGEWLSHAPGAVATRSTSDDGR